MFSCNLQHEDTRRDGHRLSKCDEPADGLNRFEVSLQVSSDVYRTYQFRINLDGDTVIHLQDFANLIDATNYAKTQYLLINDMYPYVDEGRPWFPKCKDVTCELEVDDVDDINYIIILCSTHFSTHSMNWSSKW